MSADRSSEKPATVEELLVAMRKEHGEAVPDEAPRRKKRAGRSPRHLAMDILAFRDHSRSELEEKLQRKLSAQLESGDLQPDAISAVLDELAADGLLNEDRFAESFINGRIRKGHGPLRIRRDLRQKGVSQALVDAAFADIAVDWAELAAEVRHKKFGSAPVKDYKERARQARFLQYRGFSGDQIQAAFAALE